MFWAGILQEGFRVQVRGNFHILTSKKKTLGRLYMTVLYMMHWMTYSGSPMCKSSAHVRCTSRGCLNFFLYSYLCTVCTVIFVQFVQYSCEVMVHLKY